MNEFTKLVLAIASATFITACGGGGGGDVPVAPKPAVLSLAAGHIETFNGTGAQARITQPKGIAIDSVGNTYITETGLHSVRKITPAGVVTVLVGDPVKSGSADGNIAMARFSSPGALAIDKNDNIYVLDTGNRTVRKISPTGVVTTIAGSPGMSGTDNGIGAAARFTYLKSVAVDPSGKVYVWDDGLLRKIAIDGSVTTLVLPADTLKNDVYLASDTNGNLLIASGTLPYLYDYIDPVPLLHKLTPDGVLTQIYSFNAEHINYSPYYNDDAVFNFGGIAVDGVGNIYVSNGLSTFFIQIGTSSKVIGNTILKLSPQGDLTTIAGSRGQVGFNDGQGSIARFDEPGNLALDRQGNLVVADAGNNTLRAISSAGAVTTLAGRATASADGQGSAAQLKAVVGLASDQRGNVVVAESSALRKLSRNGSLTTTVGGTFNNIAMDSRGFMYTRSRQTRFEYATVQLGLDGTSTGKRYYDGDFLALDAMDNLYAVNGHQFMNLTVATNGKIIGDLGASGAGAFAFDSAGNAYVVNVRRSSILKVSPTGTVSLLAGRDSQPGYQDGEASAAQFNSPQGIAVVGTDVYVADTGNNLIRKISQEGNVTTVAGTPGSLDTVMGQPGSLYRPTYLTTESKNSLLVVTDGKAIVRIGLQ